MNMKILVTGAAGFIGSHLCERLLTDGAEVVGLDNFDEFYSPAIKRSNITECLEHKSFTLIEGDIRDVECVAGVLSRSDINTIVHLAARAGVRPSIEQPLLYQDVNINGTMVLLEAAKEYGIRKFI
ncbi:MAG: GDP-mannose 4,6-dehydratase, partial [Sedimentisphaerales bacterium]|nr:GDP-mannose 4,6-dehydratase [Sedimentisphaerales bacterium]